MERRLREHNYAKQHGTETKYQVIRDIEADGGTWEMVLLEEVGPGTERYEDFWVYTLLMEGYALANMKAGDAKQQAQQDAMRSMQGRGERYSSAAVFLDAVQREVAEAAARAATARTQARLRRDELHTAAVESGQSTYLTLFADHEMRDAIRRAGKFESAGIKALRAKAANRKR